MPERTDELERLRDALDGWVARLALEERPALEIEVSPEEDERLHSIGYGGG